MLLYQRGIEQINAVRDLDRDETLEMLNGWSVSNSEMDQIT